MNKQLSSFVEKIDALGARERVLMVFTLLLLLGFVWWNFYGLPLQVRTADFSRQNKALEGEIRLLDSTVQSIQQRITGGVHSARQQELGQLKQDLQRVNQLLNQKTLELIEPEEMFELMQQLIFAESKLKLTGMKRKQVVQAFTHEDKEAQGPVIYRHVMQMSFEGKFQDISGYISRMEGLKWKLIWDKISLKTTEYPTIRAEIEISTLSDNKHWVGL